MSLTENIPSARVTEFLFYKSSQYNIPLSGTFELTPTCNFSCRMCYVRKTAAEVAASPRKMMTLEQWLTVARDAKNAGMLFLLLTGGEPLSWPHFWELYEAVYDMGIIISVNTNGSLIDENAVERWKRRPPQRVNITLYGASDDTYESLCRARKMYSRVKNAILALRSAGIVVKLNCSLTPYNADDLEEMTAFAKELGVLMIVTTYMFPPLRRDAELVGTNERFTPEEAAKYHLKQNLLLNGEERHHQFLLGVLNGTCDPPGLDESCIDPMDGRIRCRAGKATFWVTWDGWMTPCGMMPDPREDLQNYSFSECWNKTIENSTMVHTSGICANCPDIKLCHSCAAMAVTETGRTDGIPRYLCRMVEAMKHYAELELSGHTAL